MSLVNDSIKFQMAILQIDCDFLLIKCDSIAKDSHIFSLKMTVYLLLKSIYS